MALLFARSTSQATEKQPACMGSLFLHSSITTAS